VSPAVTRHEAPGGIRVSRPVYDREDGAVVVRFKVTGAEAADQLWFRIDGEASCIDRVVAVQRVEDAALLALLIPAMSAGKDLVFDGPVDAELCYFAGGDIQYLLQVFMPWLHTVSIRAADDNRPCPPPGERRVSLGFSGGVDSSYSLLKLTGSDVPPGMRISDLVVSNVGNYGQRTSTEDLYNAAIDNAGEVAGFFGFPVTGISSNMAEFYPGTIRYELVHSICQMSAATTLQGYTRCHVYSSGMRYVESVVGSSDDIAYMDAVLLPMMSTSRIRFLSFGGHVSRLEKTCFIAEQPLPAGRLDICVSPRRDPGGRNCGVCWKCTRYLLTMEARGSLENCRDRFEVDAYLGNRTAAIAAVLCRKVLNHNRNDRDVVQFARSRGVSIPLRSRLNVAAELFRRRAGKLRKRAAESGLRANRSSDSS